MEKRGVGHIEAVLSFVIFIAALSITFYLFGPGETSRITESSLDAAKEAVISNISVGILNLMVNVNDSKGNFKDDQEGGGSKLTIDIGVNVSENAKVIARNLADEPKEANIKDNPNRYIICIKVHPGNIGQGQGQGQNKKVVDDFLFLHAGEDIIPYINKGGGSDFGCNPNDQPNETLYQIGPRFVKNYISENRTIKLNSTYYSNYDNAKKQLGIPKGIDFSFSLKYAENDLLKAERFIPEGTDVIVSTTREEVMRTDGRFTFADFIVKIW